jgi:uncharacterized iron-regulated membrane protein
MGFVKQPQTLWWRKLLFQVHLWIGVIIGLYVVMICLTGIVLVFQTELRNSNKPELPMIAGQAAPRWGRLVDTALRENPGSSLSYIDMRSDNRRVVPVGLVNDGETIVAYMDAHTGNIVGREKPGETHWMLDFADEFHTALMGGLVGKIGNAIGGALLFIMAVIGIVLWWPGVRNWKRALVVKWKGRWWAFSHDAHRTFGFWTVLIIAMWGITGALFMFPNQVPKVFNGFSAAPGLSHLDSTWKSGDAVLPVGQFISQAQQMYPDDKLAYVYMKLQSNGEVQVYMSPRPAVPMELLEDEVVFDAGNGAVLMNTASAEWSASERAALGIYSVHFGDFGGLPIKIIWAILGFIPVLLVITAYVMWWNHVLKRKWKKLTAGRLKPGTASRARVQ